MFEKIKSNLKHDNQDPKQRKINRILYGAMIGMIAGVILAAVAIRVLGEQGLIPLGMVLGLIIGLAVGFILNSRDKGD